jgi:type IV pilus assembly protein PilN
MIRINLLPPEYAAAQRKKESQFIAGTAGGVLVLFLSAFWMIKSAQAATLVKKNVAAEAELKKYQAIIAQIDKIEADKRALTSKRDVIRNLNQSRLVYPVLFEDLLPIIPSDVWVNSIQIQELGDRKKLVLASNALSNFAVATLLTNLQQSQHFASIELSPINYSGPETSQTLVFTINCTYKHQGPFPLSEFN